MSSGMPRQSLEDVSKAGGVGYAAWLFQHGYDAADVADRVQRRFGGATQRTVTAVVNRGAAAALAGTTLSSGGPGGTVPARQIPGPRSAVPNFRFVGILELLDDDGQVVDQYPFDLPNESDLDADTLRNTVVAMYLAGARPTARRGRSPQRVIGWTPGELLVTYVERTYP